MAAATVDKPVKKLVRLDDASRLAVIAAVAAGRSQGEVAKEFNVHRNTVWSLCNNTKAVVNVANPMSDAYKPVLKVKAVGAIKRGLDCKRDPYKAANIGVKVLEGIGEFSQHSQVDEHREIVVRWAGFDDVQARDVTPEDNSTT